MEVMAGRFDDKQAVQQAVQEKRALMMADLPTGIFSGGKRRFRNGHVHYRFMTRATARTS